MNNKSASRIVVAALGLALAGAGIAAPRKGHHPAAHPAAHAPAAPEPPPPCVPGDPSFWRDQALTTKVAMKLQFHKPLLREHADVKVTGGAAMLSGNMSSQQLIDEAVRTAAGVEGVKCVQDFLKVGPPIPHDPAQQ